MRRIIKPVVAVVLLALLAVGVVYVRWRGETVSTVQPRRGPVVQTVVSSGRVLPPAEIKLGALVASTVTEVLVAEGDVVVAGQPLVRLDDGPARAALKEAEAALAQAKAGRYELAKLSAPAAGAELRQAEANLEQAERHLERTRTLFDSGASTRVGLEEAETGLSVAKARHEAAKLQVKASKAGGSQSLRAAAGVAIAEAQLFQAKEQLARTQVEAPADGVVIERQIEPGDAVVVGSRLLVLSRRGATRLVIEPDERNLALLAIGQPALASAEAFPRERFAAEVSFLAPSIDPQRGTVEVRLSVPEPPAYLRPHMTVAVEIEAGRNEDALLIPRAAVRGLATDSPYALLVTERRIERRALLLGLQGERQVEVLQGLTEADTIVVDETLELQAGQRVRPRAE